jgi:crossover junction endodeoxyribonuclease RuvC
MRVLAIDPGYGRLGIAVVEGDPSRPTLVMSTCLVPDEDEPSLRLAEIATTIQEAIRAHNPDILGIETLFFSTNKKTALGVAEARGAVLAIAGLAHLPVIECSPQAVKLAVTGHGAADKKAIALMLPKLIALPERKRLDDELDAIAVGITTLTMGRLRRK